MSSSWNKPLRLVQILLIGALGACSTNPATGEKQFTALMPPAQEASIGAQEHQKVEEQFGKFIGGPIAGYVNQVGQKVAANTERSDVQYKFYVVDSPTVNAFAIPGGYIYITRGLLTLANSEAELAGVLAHEIGHITGRHAAARTSQGALVGIGAAVLSAAVGSPVVSQAANIGSDLYIKSYSRGQEHEADTLGVRYLSRAGYDPRAMSSFLSSLQAETALQSKITGKDSNVPPYFSTHPLTQDRVVEAGAEAGKYPAAGNANRDVYLNAINGMVYGDSADQGFVRGNTFYHTQLGFKYSVPEGCNIVNTPQQVVSQCQDGSLIAFDAAGDTQGRDPKAFLTEVWASGRQLQGAEAITINGMQAAAGTTQGTVNGTAMNLVLVAIQWEAGKYFRFMIAIPKNASTPTMEAMKRTTYSFARLSEAEKSQIRPARIQTFTAQAGNTVQSVANAIPFGDYKVERIQVLNGLKPGENFTPGARYKTIVQ